MVHEHGKLDWRVARVIEKGRLALNYSAVFSRPTAPYRYSLEMPIGRLLRIDAWLTLPFQPVCPVGSTRSAAFQAQIILP